MTVKNKHPLFKGNPSTSKTPPKIDGENPFNHKWSRLRFIAGAAWVVRCGVCNETKESGGKGNNGTCHGCKSAHELQHTNYYSDENIKRRQAK